jgi:hypothetical protein
MWNRSEIPPFCLSTWLSHPQVFPISLTAWTPEIIQQEDVPASFELFVSYSTEYKALRFLGDNSYEYCGPLDFDEDAVNAATKWDIVQYRRLVSKGNPWSNATADG